MRYQILDYLRGVAALFVCLCHFGQVLPAPVAAVVKHGELGVYAFFVISGFIIPYSMIKGGYGIGGFGRFWVKRLWRLQPTFFVALVVTFVLSQASAWTKGVGSEFSALHFLKTFFYQAVPGENPVIWTLVIEMKYYLAISLLFPLVFAEVRWVRIASFVGCALGGVALEGVSIDVKFVPFFLIGFCACYHVCGRAARWESLALGAVAVAASFAASDAAQIAVGVVTAGLILLNPAFKFRVGAFFGAISYSLYLIHFPIGVKLINYFMPRVGGAYHPLLFAGALGGSIGAAWLLYWLVEKPSSERSQKIKFDTRSGRQKPVPIATPV